MKTGEKYPRTLVLSSNCFSTLTNNGKMLASFLKDYNAESLAQIYAYPEQPNSSVCLKYYRITDMDMLRAFVCKGGAGSEIEYLSENNNRQDFREVAIYKNIIKNSYFARFVRELVWSHNRWKRKLFEWLDEFCPEILFFSGTNTVALYRIAESIIKRYKIPVIIYVTDDYFLPRFSLSPFFHIRRKMLNKAMNSLLHKHHSQLLVVNEYMKEAYLKQFKKNSEVIMHHISMDIDKSEKKSPNEKIVISYIGNLSQGRHKTLAKIKNTLTCYKNKEKFKIKIFTRERLSDRVMKSITLDTIMTYCGELDLDGVKQQLVNSDILLHFESFSYRDRKDTLLSLSTKITEYMMAGRPILMVGPREVGSYRFLSNNTNNICIDNVNAADIQNALDILIDGRLRCSIGEENREIISSIFENRGSSQIVLECSHKLLRACSEARFC